MYCLVSHPKTNDINDQSKLKSVLKAAFIFRKGGKK